MRYMYRMVVHKMQLKSSLDKFYIGHLYARLSESRKCTAQSCLLCAVVSIHNDSSVAIYTGIMSLPRIVKQ